MRSTVALRFSWTISLSILIHDASSSKVGWCWRWSQAHVVLTQSGSNFSITVVGENVLIHKEGCCSSPQVVEVASRLTLCPIIPHPKVLGDHAFTANGRVPIRSKEIHGHSIKFRIGCKEVSPLIDVMSSPHTALIRGRPVVLVLLEGISDRFIPPIGSREAQVGVINVLPVELLGLLVGVNLFPLPRSGPCNV